MSDTEPTPALPPVEEVVRLLRELTKCSAGDSCRHAWHAPAIVLEERATLRALATWFEVAYPALVRAREPEWLVRIERVLSEFDERDAIALEVFYRVSPRFVADVRLLLTEWRAARVSGAAASEPVVPAARLTEEDYPDA